MLQNVPLAPVWNRDREWRRKRFYLTPIYIPQTLEDTILDLYRYQLTEQQQRTIQEPRAHITTVEAGRQRQVEGVQINQIMEEWRNENANTLDYEEQQIFENDRGNGDLNVDRNMQENILRIVSNKFHWLLISEF